jgi:hypothetical protein
VAAIDFELDQGENLVISANILKVPAFERLWVADKTENHQEARLDLKWVKLACEEEGPYSNYFGTERVIAVNRAVYGTGSPVIAKKRMELRDFAATVFVENNETLEGRSLEFLKRRIYVIQSVLKEKELSLDKLKGDDAALKKYLDDSENLSNQLLKLTKQTNDILAEIKKQGGRTKVKNQANAITTPNEAGMLSKDKIKSRRALSTIYAGGQEEQQQI